MKQSSTRYIRRSILCSFVILALTATTAFGATTKKSTNVYASPKQQGKVITTIPSGTTVTLIAQNGNAYKIKTASGQVGYVAKSSISNEKTAKSSDQTAIDSSNSYARASSGNKNSDEVLKLLNEERRKAKLPEFLFDTRLQKAAKIRSDELTEAFNSDHSRPDGTSIFTIFDEIGLENVYQSENIASGQTTPQEVVDSWLNSPLHKANIMNKNHSYIGVSSSKNADGKLVWSLLFWGPADK